MYRLLFFLFGLSAICYFCREAVAQIFQIGVSMASDSQMTAGGSLREDIEQAYRMLAAEGRLISGPRGVDVVGVVGKSIKIGIQFSDAEEILRSAGFSVGSRPDADASTNPNRSRDWYAVVASLPLAPTGPFQKATVYVTLLPLRPGDYSVVAGLSASIIISTP
jgi:hypothetical protein